LNQDLPQSYFPVRRDSDESRGSHAPSSLSTLLDTRTPAPVSARGEPASSGARETHSFSVTRSSGDRLDSPRSYIPSSQNSDERQEFRDAASFPYDGNAPSTALRETGAAGGRSTERQESLASYQPSRRDSDERRQARVVGTSLHPEMHLLNGQFPPSALEGRQVAGMRDVASKAPVDRRESPTTYYLGRGPDVYQQASRAIPDGYDPVSAPGEMGRREMQPAPEMGDFSERRESTQSVQPRGVSPGRYSGSRDSPTAASAFGRNGESHPADSLHATRMNSDDRLETSSRAVPLSSSPPEYYSSNGQDARLSANQTAPSRSAPPSRETPSLRPLSRSSPPQPLRRSSDEAPAGDITVCGAQGMLSIKRCVRWNDNLICPSPILASQRRKGWYNCRGYVYSLYSGKTAYSLRLSQGSTLDK
jgi:hypothetical protein